MPHDYDIHTVADLVDGSWVQPEPKPTATGSLLRISDAAKCSRAIAFGALNVPKDYETPGSVLMAFDVGDQFHARIQGLVADAWDAELEVRCTYEPDYPISGSADFVYDRNGEGVVGEIKTLSGYGWGIAAGTIRSDESGPKMEHSLQAALYAGALGLNYVHMVYVDKDKHGIAEWLLDVRDEFLDSGMSLAFMVERELARFAGIAASIERDEWPARFIPEIGYVDRVPPYARKGGKPWQCTYCQHREKCAILPTGATPMLTQETG